MFETGPSAISRLNFLVSPSRGKRSEIFKPGDQLLDLYELAGKLRLAVEASRMGVWEYDQATDSVHWDDRMLEMYGITDGQNTRPSDSWETHIHPDDLATMVAYAEECKENSMDFRRDYRIIREDGTVRHIRSLAQSVEGPDGLSKLIGVNIDVTEDYLQAEELKKAQRQLHHEARHDALTGLGNRRRWDEITMALFNRLEDNERYCIMQLDLDHFKEINDVLGHPAGDFVLQTVARCLTRIIGNTGLSFRVGGDEFAVLFEEAPSEEHVTEMCSALVEAIARPIVYAGDLCTVGVSIGYAFGKGPPDNPSETFNNADAALYAAKHQGRSCYRAYSSVTTREMHSVSNARQDLLRALREDELQCYYQPQYDAKTLQIVGAEALVRWNCPVRGVLTPEAFLPLAAKFGLLATIDAKVLGMVTAQQSIWATEGVAYPRISVNTSAARLNAKDLIETTRNILDQHSRIAFELLETAFLDDLDDGTAANIEALRDMGIRIELDDFGSGHSSVTALQTVRPDRVKIDRTLVAPLSYKPGQIQTLRSLTEIARLEGAKVVVEGLESGLQLAAIRGVDCDVLQGYALQRPMRTMEFTALLSRADIAQVDKPA